VNKFLHKGGGHALLPELSTALDTAKTWDADGIQAALEAFAEAHELGLGKIAQPLRLALTGTAASPSIHETVALFSKDEVQARIARCMEATAL
jgi:glutamyl-tRNA synthetase